MFTPAFARAVVALPAIPTVSPFPHLQPLLKPNHVLWIYSSTSNSFIMRSFTRRSFPSSSWFCFNIMDISSIPEGVCSYDNPSSSMMDNIFLTKAYFPVHHVFCNVNAAKSPGSCNPYNGTRP